MSSLSKRATSEPVKAPDMGSQGPTNPSWGVVVNIRAHPCCDWLKELLVALETKGRACNALVLESFVCLMTAHWPEDLETAPSSSSGSADIMSPSSSAAATARL